MIDGILKNHELIKDIASQLKQANLTVNIRFEGETVVKVGAETAPFMLGVIGDVEIVDMESAVKLADSLSVLS